MKYHYLLIIGLFAFLVFGLSFNVNASEIDSSDNTVLVSFVCGRRLLKQERVQKGSKVVFPEPQSEDGYEFDGWDMSVDVDINNVQTDVTFIQKWKKKEITYHINSEKYQEIENNISEKEIKTQEALVKYDEVKTTKPKLSFNKKKNKITIKTDKNITDVVLYYSKTKDFDTYKVFEGKVKDGKTSVKLKQLKKIKKGKTYYIKVMGMVKYDIDGNEMVKSTKISKVMKVKRK